jgi:hypothetical protein
MTQKPFTLLAPLPSSADAETTAKLYLARQNLGRVFNFKCVHVCTTCTSYVSTKLPNLKWKTRPEQLFGSLPLAFALPAEADAFFLLSTNLINLFAVTEKQI